MYFLAMSTHNLLRNKCEVYAAYVLDTKVSKSKFEEVSIVSENSDVFLEELLGLPPNTEVEFAIKVASRTPQISIAPYRMTLTKLKELKTQLQELLIRDQKMEAKRKLVKDGQTVSSS